MLSERFAVLPALSPASATNSTATSVYVNSKGGRFVYWYFLQKTAGSNTGTYTLTVKAASDSSGTGATAVTFRYRKKTTATSSDTWGAVTAATTSGFLTTANEDSIYEIEIESSEVAFLQAGKPWVALCATQGTSDTLATAAIAMITDVRYQGATMPTMLA